MWNRPDTGVAFSPEELARRTEWNFQLTGLVLVQQRVEKQAQNLDPKTINPDQAAGIVDQIKGLIDLVNTTLASAPTIPDKWLDRDKGMKRYMQELERRAEAMLAVNAAGAAGSGQASEPNQ
jgi:hypothetical protein